jgi:hypothetical protein
MGTNASMKHAASNFRAEDRDRRFLLTVGHHQQRHISEGRYHNSLMCFLITRAETVPLAG